MRFLFTVLQKSCKRILIGLGRTKDLSTRNTWSVNLKQLVYTMPPRKKGRAVKVSEKVKEDKDDSSSDPIAEEVPQAKRKKKSEPKVAKPTAKQSKLTVKSVSKEEETDGSVEGKVKDEVTSKTDLSKLDFKLADKKTSDGRVWNFKACSWNVNGVRAWLKNNPLKYLEEESPDVICLQETKCDKGSLPLDLLDIPGYTSYWNSCVSKKGYSGTGFYSKAKPLKVTFGMGIEEHDQEGRLIVAEYEKFFFVGCYVPNAGDKLKRLDYRMEWDKAFKTFIKKLDDQKPIIYTGDLNVAHNPIDLANPKSNKNTAGFTQEERDSFTGLLELGYVDSFRHLYPDQAGAYSYWSYRMNARARNVGWRLDYFVISHRLLPNLCDNIIRAEVHGSDHCPIILLMAMDEP